MADVITRFKLETTQYDSKLRDAAKGLADYARQASFAGSEFDKFTKNNADAARALGSISTSATNAKDKVKELVAAYNQAANAYNALTKEQQQSDWGKALAESINTLKGRITEAKRELYSMGDSAKNSGGIMEQLAQKFTVNIDALKLFNAGVTAAKAALDVAKDAFFASEENVDEWGRTMESAESLYEGFLSAINNGDISGYLSRMNDIVLAARAAYDEMDKLNTMKTIQGPGISKQEAENNRFRLMIQTGRWISAGDGRKSPLGLKDGDLLSPEQIKTLERQLQGGLGKVTKLIGNEVKQTGKAIDRYYEKLAKDNGISLEEFKKGTSSWDEFKKKIQGYEDYKKWNDKAASDYYRQGGRNGFMNFDKGNPYLDYKKWGNFRVDKMGKDSFNELVGLIKQRDQQVSQLYSTMAQSYRAINRAEGITVKGIMNGGSGGSGGSGQTEIEVVTGSIDEQTKKVQELQKAWRAAADDDSREKIKKQIEEQQYVLDRMTGKEKFDPSKLQEMKAISVAPKVPKFEDYKVPDITPLKQQLQIEINAENVKVDQTALTNLMKDAIQDGINGMDFQFGSLSDQIAKGIDVPDEKWKSIIDQYNQLREQIGLQPIQVNFETGNVETVVKDGKDISSSMSSAASAISSVGSALQSIEDPSAKVMGIIAQAIATIAQSFAGALASDTTTKSNIWAFIGASAASMAAMVSAISQIHSATGYAQGGIIKGNSYSGDNVGGLVDGSQLVGLNAGELVLTRAQQSNLAQSLQDNGGGINVTGYLRGEDIVMVVDRYGRRTGKGELAFWK